MKKITALLALAVMAVLSCQKPGADTFVSKKESFTASVEAFAPVTKTSMTSKRSVVWSENDKIAIFQGSAIADEYEVVTGVGQLAATFSRVIESGAGDDFSAGTEIPCNVALYPYATGLTLEGAAREDEGTAYKVEGVVLPSEQTYVAGSFANGAFLMAAVTDDLSDHNLKFKNVLGALKLQLKGSQTVKSIKVTGKSGEVLSGAAVVTVYSNNLTPAITMTAADEASKSVTLNCGDGVDLSESTATDFIIALPPELFSQGFIVTVTDSDDRTYEVTADVANTVLRSSVLTMPEVALGEPDNEPDVPVVKMEDYIDEYGINQGSGIRVGNIVWAPVNCGYHATDFKYGKLYQWGRKYGQGYDSSDASTPAMLDGGISLSDAQSENNENVFFVVSSETSYDWLYPHDGTLWNSGTESEPIKNVANDPCPEGWRVPTYTELTSLIVNHSILTYDEHGFGGYYFLDVESSARVFLSLAGCRVESGGEYDREITGNYWSSKSDAAEAMYLAFRNSDLGVYSHYSKSYGYSVRCVQESGSGDNQDANLTYVEYIFLDKTSLTMYPETSYILVADIDPVDVTYPTLTWSSSDNTVATVDQTGRVTAVSDGTATITALAVGGVSATCTVKVKSATTTEVKNYVVDGVNYGAGIKIGQTVWAPVNCGYEPADGDYKGYPYGKLYQWGRPYGQGYSTYYDATEPVVTEGPVMPSVGKSEDNKNVFYEVTTSPYDWCRVQIDDLWGYGTDEKSATDPCPDGWRVPTYDELNNLNDNYSSWTTDSDNLNGYYFVGEYTYMEGIPQVFFPAAGNRSVFGNAYDRGSTGDYWSSEPDRSYAYILHFTSSGVVSMYDELCAHGYSVRCVQE